MAKSDETRDRELAALLEEVRSLRHDIEILKNNPVIGDAVSAALEHAHDFTRYEKSSYAVAVRPAGELPPDYVVAVRPGLERPEIVSRARTVTRTTRAKAATRAKEATRSKAAPRAASKATTSKATRGKAAPKATTKATTSKATRGKASARVKGGKKVAKVTARAKRPGTSKN